MTWRCQRTIGSNSWYVSKQCPHLPLSRCECRRCKVLWYWYNWVEYKDNTQMIACWVRRTNLFTDSEDFSLSKVGTWVITPNATIAPDGRMTVDLLTLKYFKRMTIMSIKTITTTIVSMVIHSRLCKGEWTYSMYKMYLLVRHLIYETFDLVNGVVGTSSSYTW